MVTAGELDELLRQWGRAYGQRPPREWDEDCSLTGTNPIATAMEYAVGSRAKAVAVAWRRRRPFAAFTQPMPCKETRPATSVALTGGNARRFTPEIERVQTAVMALHRAHPLRGAVLQAEYCTRGRQFDKAEHVAQLTGERLNVRRYRGELGTAKFWMLARLG